MAKDQTLHTDAIETEVIEMKCSLYIISSINIFGNNTNWRTLAFVLYATTEALLRERRGGIADKENQTAIM